MREHSSSDAMSPVALLNEDSPLDAGCTPREVKERNDLIAGTRYKRRMRGISELINEPTGRGCAGAPEAIVAIGVDPRRHERFDFAQVRPNRPDMNDHDERLGRLRYTHLCTQARAYCSIAITGQFTVKPTGPKALPPGPVRSLRSTARFTSAEPVSCTFCFPSTASFVHAPT